MMMTMMQSYHVVRIPQNVLSLKLGWADSYLPLIVPRFLVVDGFFVFLIVQFFRQLQRELGEAAQIDGCSPFKIYWAVILPLSLPAMGTAAIFSVIRVWEDFLAPLIYLNDINSYTAPLALRLFVDQEGQSAFWQMFAMSVLSLVPVLIFFVAFQKLNLDIVDGAFLVLVDPYGCGKSTLLRMSAGLEDISEGGISIGGIMVNDLTASKRHLSMVFQSYALCPHMSVRKNLAFGLQNLKIPAAEINRRVAEAAKALQIRTSDGSQATTAFGWAKAACCHRARTAVVSF